MIARVIYNYCINRTEKKLFSAFGRRKHHKLLFQVRHLNFCKCTKFQISVKYKHNYKIVIVFDIPEQQSGRLTKPSESIWKESWCDTYEVSLSPLDSGLVLWFECSKLVKREREKVLCKIKKGKQALNKRRVIFCSCWCEHFYLIAAPQLGVVLVCVPGACRVWYHSGSHTARMWGHCSGFTLPAPALLVPGTPLSSSCSYMKFLLL